MIVARAARAWPLGWQHGSDASSRGVGEIPAGRRLGKGRGGEHRSLPVAARAVAPLSDGLVRAAPARPTQVEDPLGVVDDPITIPTEAVSGI